MMSPGGGSLIQGSVLLSIMLKSFDEMTKYNVATCQYYKKNYLQLKVHKPRKQLNKLLHELTEKQVLNKSQKLLKNRWEKKVTVCFL